MMIDVNFLIQSPGWRWSYSRLRQFESCKYGWLLKYVFEVPQRKLFFSVYGKLMHELIAGALSGALSWQTAELQYARRFHDVLLCHAPPGSVRAGYFMNGLRYLQSEGASLKGFQPLAIEQYVGFVIECDRKVTQQFTSVNEHEHSSCGNSRVGVHPFCGYIDLVARDDVGSLFIVDHKSRDLKERGGRRIKSNALLDEYLRQLYLYSIPVAEQYGSPGYLAFNCFRTGTLIKEPFSQAAFEETIAWALHTIEDILRETDWLPCEDAWKCRYLCDVAGECEYANL
jgi:hypothetical protein